jgi:DNA-binding winged helix-turn-helix (wHTH) protein
MDTIPRIAGIYEFGHYRLDPVRRTLTRAGAPVDLTPRLFDTLLYLLENRTRVVERGELERAVWGSRQMDGGNLAMAISSLRKFLHGDGSMQTLIATTPGRGYQFVADVTYEPRLPVQYELGITPTQANANPGAAYAVWLRRSPAIKVVAVW